MKRVIVACGSGVATSQTVASKIQRLLDKEGIRAKVDAVDIKSIRTHIKQTDAYVAITPDKTLVTDVPIINGIAFLTGMGQKEEFAKLVEVLTK